MQQSRRAPFNPALEFAIVVANQADLPALVAFGLMDDYPEANLRHFGFMPEGLREVAATLAERGIGLLVRRRLGQPATVLTRMTF